MIRTDRKRRICLGFGMGVLCLSVMLMVCVVLIQRRPLPVGKPESDSKHLHADFDTVGPANVAFSTARSDPHRRVVEPAAIRAPGLTGNAIDRSLVEFARKADAKYDDWPVEVFSESVSGQLRILEKAIAGSTARSSLDTGQLLANDFRSTDLRPGSMQRAFQDHVLTVSRSVPSNDLQPLIHHGADELFSAIESLREPLSGAEEVSVHLKLYRVHMDAEEATTTIAYHAYGRGMSGVVEQHATWQCGWTVSGAESRPRIRTVRVTEYEETTPNVKVASLFSDCTAAVFENSPSFRNQLVYGIDHWRRRLESSLEPNLSGNQGVMLADFNGDGLEDVYICQQGGLANRLLFQTSEGRLRDASADAGVDQLELTSSALGLDLDGDGDQDLVLATVDRILFFENDGQGRFRQRAELEAHATLQSLTAADYDLDADVDIYACGYSPGTSIWKSHDGLGAPVPYYDANNGGPNLLVRNDGGFVFTDVTKQSGLDENNRRFSFAASWEDYDNDGDADLYVANDFGRNSLYRNDKGHFHDVAEKAGVEDMATGMSVSWGDYNNDGWMDVYVGNMFSSAGNRVAYQRQFLPAAGEATKIMVRRVARGNSLFQNGPSGKFADISESAAVTRGRWAWSSMFADINNDGREDIVVANGFVTHKSTRDL